MVEPFTTPLPEPPHITPFHNVFLQTGIFLQKHLIIFETSLKIVSGSLVGYCLAIANIPNIVPPTQATFIGWLSAYLVTTFPTLQFAIIQKVIPQFFAAVFTLAPLTALLVFSALGGDPAVVAGWFGYTFWVGCLYYRKKTSSFVPLILLYTIPDLAELYGVVQEPGGLEMIRQSWTESGVSNSAARVQNFLVAWGWILLALITPHLLPPWRTARQGIVRDMLPKILRDNAKFLLLSHPSSQRKRGGSSPALPGGECEFVCDIEYDFLSSSPHQLDKIRFRMLKNILTLTDDLATLVAFEPLASQLFSFPPISGHPILRDVLTTVRQFTIHNLMSTRFFKAMGKGGEEWEGKGKAIIEITEALEVTAKDLERSLYPITPFPSHFHPTFPTSLLHLPDFSHWGVGEGGEQEWEKDGWGHGWWEEGNDIVEENDPYLLKSRFRRVHEAVEKWKMSMRMGVCSTPPTFFSRRWRDSLKGVFLPWFQACFQVWIDLFYNVPSYLFSKKFYWRLFERDSNDDWIKGFFILKFAVGATVLFIIQLFWQISITGDQFAGWEMIGYVSAVTHTTEGTVKKGLLRLLGTCTGGFSGWLALTAFAEGDGQHNPYAVVAWICVCQFFAIILGLENNIQARLGLLPDFGHAIQLFVATQAIVVFSTFNTTSDKDQVVANRVSSQAVGIFIGVIFSMIPPRVLAGDPTRAHFILDRQEVKVLNLLQVVASAAEEEDPTPPQETIDLLNQSNGAAHAEIQKLFQEANFFFSDAHKLLKFPFFRLHPLLRTTLSQMITTCYILEETTLLLAREIISSPLRAEFSQGTPFRKWLEGLKMAIQTGERFEREAPLDRYECGPSRRFLTLVEYCVVRMKEQRNALNQVKYGFYWKMDEEEKEMEEEEEEIEKETE